MPLPEAEYAIPFFHDGGFARRRCPSCGAWFWTLGAQETCGETPCEEYAFIGRSPMKKSLTPRAMREDFLSFLEQRAHTRIRRYPVVARWRDDVFYTQASVYPFQPWVIEGYAEPPANPLAISQPCVRFNDIDDVGKTGEHFTFFEMMAHHAFNRPGKTIYWKDRTVELCQEFFTDRLGVEPARMAYKEAWWKGGGNSGPCFEVLLAGAEVATLVFMQYKELNGGRVPMDTQVVDTGYGLERIAWVSQGTTSAYEAVFGDTLSYLKRATGLQRVDARILSEYSRVAGATKVESFADVRQIRRTVADRLGIAPEELVAALTPLENLYALCDHTRALAFVLGDGVVPSNVKEGYFARLLVRRALRAMKALDLEMDLDEIVAMQVQQAMDDFPELFAARGTILKLAKIEQGRYEETLAKGRGVVERLEADVRARGRDRIDPDALVELYDSHGLNPEVVEEFATLPVEIPDDFYARVAARHETPPEEAGPKLKVDKPLPPTRLRVYENRRKRRFAAKVLALEGNAVVLDQTYFYPEGGGQEADRGRIGDYRVVDVQSVGSSILHLVEGTPKLPLGKRVICEIDWDRRRALTRNHTATHIVLGAARRVLDGHVWQAGAHKAEEVARLDITHFASLTEEEWGKIENLANDIVLRDLRVSQKFMAREVAEQKFGFRLYQGGSVPGREVRVVEIPGWDAEACGGTHVSRTSEVGLIKLMGARRIQDGVVRLEYAAGKAALRFVQKEHAVLAKMSGDLNVPPEELPQAVARFYQEWKEQRKRLERFETQEAAGKVERLLAAADRVGDVRVVVHLEPGGMRNLMALARQLTAREGVVAVLGARNESASLIVGRSSDIPIDCVAVLRPAAELVGGRGGGRADFAQGGGPDVGRIEDALEAAKEGARKALST